MSQIFSTVLAVAAQTPDGDMSVLFFFYAYETNYKSKSKINSLRTVTLKKESTKT